MGKLIVLLLLLSVTFTARAASVLDGRWKFSRLRYQDRPMDPPNPDLQIFFEFSEDGTDRLYWRRAGENGFCERRAKFEVGTEVFTELVIWVNPANNPDCGRDPDMQLGRRTENVYRLREGHLEIDANFGSDVLTYIWERQGTESPP